VPTGIWPKFFDDEIPAHLTQIGHPLSGGGQFTRYRVDATGQEFLFEEDTGLYYNLEGQPIDPRSLAPAEVEVTTGHPPDNGPPPDRSAVGAESSISITLEPVIHDTAEELEEIDLEPSQLGRQLLIVAVPLLLRFARSLISRGIAVNTLQMDALTVLARMAAANPELTPPTDLVVSVLHSFALHLVEQAGDVSESAEWQLRSAVDRFETLGRTEEEHPDIEAEEWQRLIELPSLESEKPEFSHFAPHAPLLSAVRRKIGQHAASALVLGADKDLLYPYLATGAKETTIVSTDVNSPYRRARDLMIHGQLAYPMSPPGVMASGEEASIHVTSGFSAHAFHLYDMLYGEFFQQHKTDEEYDFLLDKTSYLGMNMFDLSRFVRALKTGGYWLTHFSYLDRDQRLILKLLGLEDVTDTIVTREQAESFPGGTLRIYRKVVRFPPQWIDLIHAWYGMVQHILNATGRGKNVPLYADRDLMEGYSRKFTESTRLLFALQALLLKTESEELEAYLREAFDELLQVYDEMQAAIRTGFERVEEEEEEEERTD
jgi:hypothetical protein